MTAAAESGDVMARWRTPLLLALAALAARGWEAATSLCISSDGPVYVEVAARYAAGDWSGGLAHVYHPLYPLLMALFHTVLPDWEHAGQAVSVLAGGLGVVPLWLLTRRLYDDRTAVAAAVLYAFSPYPVRLSGEVLTTGLYLGLTLTALWAAVEGWTQQRPRYLLLAGLASGLAYLTRVDGLVLGLALLGWTTLLRPRGWREAPRARALLVAAVLAGLMLAAGPYVLYLSIAQGGFSLSRKTNAATFTSQWSTASPTESQGTGANPDSDPQKPPGNTTTDPPPGNQPAAGNGTTPLPPRVWDDKHYDSALQKWLAALGRVFVETGSAAPWALLPFLLLGAGLAWRAGPHRAESLAVLSVPLAFELALLVFSATHYRESKRYTTPIAVWLLPWGGLALAWFSAQAARLRPGPRTAAIMLASALTLYVVGHIPKTFKRLGVNKRGEKAAGLWLREQAGGTRPTLVTTVGSTVYYADARPIWLLSTVGYTPEAIVATLRSSGAQWLVVDRGLERSCPGFFAWAADPARSGLTLVRAFPKGDGSEDQVTVFTPK